MENEKKKKKQLVTHVPPQTLSMLALFLKCPYTALLSNKITWVYIIIQERNSVSGCPYFSAEGFHYLSSKTHYS